MPKSNGAETSVGRADWRARHKIERECRAAVCKLGVQSLRIAPIAVAKA